MATYQDQREMLDQIARLNATLADKLAAERPGDGAAMAMISKEIDSLLQRLSTGQSAAGAPPDGGIAQLIGLGPDASDDIGDTHIGTDIQQFDETMTSERVLAIADLYYAYQYERLGVFQAILKLQELFRAGRVRLSSGEGALALYQFDRKKILRYSRKERMQAYKRVFGYTDAVPPLGAKTNGSFHALFSRFNTEVARYFRDKRISEVVRPEGRDLTFGSVAIVRRAGLDLRSNLKGASYGHVSVLAIEVTQLLEAAFEILSADDVRQLFGADTGWDVLQDVLKRYVGTRTYASQRSRMAVTGRDIVRYLAQPHILADGGDEFETLLLNVAESCEEWLTSAESVGLGGDSIKGKVVPISKKRKRRVASS